MRGETIEQAMQREEEEFARDQRLGGEMYTRLIIPNPDDDVPAVPAESSEPVADILPPEVWLG